MQTITYSQVQELVARLPVTKLSTAYDLLLELVSGDPKTTSSQLDFILLPLNERHRLLTQQAEQMMIGHYEQTETERQDWQGGDVVEYSSWRDLDRQS